MKGNFAPFVGALAPSEGWNLAREITGSLSGYRKKRKASEVVIERRSNVASVGAVRIGRGYSPC